MLWLEGKKWAKIRRKNGQFLPDFFGHFERCIGVKNGFREGFGETLRDVET